MVLPAVLQAESFDAGFECFPAFVAVFTVLEIELMDLQRFRVFTFLKQPAVIFRTLADVAVAWVAGGFVDVFDHYGVALQVLPVFPFPDVGVEPGVEGHTHREGDGGAGDAVIYCDY